MSFFRARVLLWPMLLLVLAVAAAGVFGVVTLWAATPFGVTTQSRSTQVVKALEKKQQVVLLAMSMVGLDDEAKSIDFHGWKIPGTEKALYLRYEFDAKLGFDGEKVKITDEGDNTLHIVIPEFSFIAYDNWGSEVVAQKDGLISLFTPAIDDREMAEAFLNDAKKEEYVSLHQDELQEQAQVFYTSIVNAIDSDVKLTYEFAQ